ncbi:IS66 family insertion sequence element accessory protein TnpB [Lichenibacterium dinghuense]|uniref:IS66 family insertion sequence element accessory protein TnpB n=1 Tax=Lichenibacterium dinghuense TaxID=2895977 RepID=UPI001F4105EC|nr:IS66 family insertion sequence element accessory protein TnpB [Lichenibacterium sp. 6Y81]
MIPVLSTARVWVAAGHTDMRRGMDGLSLVVQKGLGRDPFIIRRRKLGSPALPVLSDGGRQRR